jgi:hypothetical protein
MKTILPFLLTEVMDSDIYENNGRLDKLQLMIRILSIIESDPKNVSKEFGKLKSWIYSQLKRTISSKEEIALLEGIANYIHSDPATSERLQSMDYLFNAKFIE